MKTMKKTFLTLMLAVMIVVTGMLMIACNKKSSAKEVFEYLHSTMYDIKASDVFRAGVIDAQNVDFYLKDFSTKNQAGNYALDDPKYIQLTAAGLEFIYDNYQYIENLQIDYDYGSIYSKIEKLNEEHEKLVEEYSKMISRKSSNYNIYNGFFARYKLQTKNFINEVYNVADAVGELVVNKQGLKNTADTDQQLAYGKNVYIRYNIFKIAKDFKQFFIDSSQGAFLSEGLYDKIEDDFAEYVDSFLLQTDANYDQKAYVANQFEDLSTKLEAVDQDRKSLIKTLNEFSFYDYCVKYDGEIYEMHKDNDKVYIYYDYIESYFENILVHLRANLQNSGLNF